MRLKMTFQLKKPELDIEYRRAFLALLKKSFQQISPDLYEKLYANGTPMKPFTFGVYLPQPVFKGDTVLLQSREITLTFSTSEKKMGIYFYNAMVKNRFIPFPLSNGNSLLLQRVHPVKEKPITAGEMVFKTQTPILVRSHGREGNNDRYLTIEDERFVEQLEWSIERMFEMLKGKKEKVTVEPVKMEKEIRIMHYGQSMSGNKGIIKLAGKPEVLEFIYHCGAGSRRSEGFGLLEVVG